MPNLQFLRLYKHVGESTLHIPEDMEYLPRLKLLDWECYPRESLPLRFQPNCLVQLCMISSKLKKLWGGIQPLPSLKIINMSGSVKLKKIPDLSKATNLETLNLGYCSSLKKIPDLSKATNLERLELFGCKSLKKISDLSKATNLETSFKGSKELSVYKFQAAHSILTINYLRNDRSQNHKVRPSK